MRTRYFIAGLMAGVMLMTAIPAVAADQYIQALIEKSMILQIDNEVKTLSDDYVMLNYKNRTYLPSRYVAEELGARVLYDESSRLINIISPPPVEIEKIVEVPVEVEKIVYVERDTSYSNLPASNTADRISANVKLISRIPSYNFSSSVRVSCEVTNNTYDSNIMVNYTEATLEVDGKNTYKVADANPNTYDSGFNNDIKVGKSYEGYFSFPLIDAGTKNFVLTIPVRNQSTGTITDVVVRFTATLNEE